jgi:hypothetical protein
MVPQKRDSMRLVPVVGKPGDLQLAVDGPDDEVRLLAALEEAKVLAEELRRGAVITGEEMYTRLGMPEFRSPEGDAPMTVVTFSLLLPLLYPGYDLSESAGKDAVGERYDRWQARPSTEQRTGLRAQWRMRPVVGASHILIGM